jgi:prevent-host-death family protein
MNMKSVSIENARKILGDLVDRARIADEPVLIKRYNKPAAVLVSAEWYREAASLMQLQRERGAQ